MRPFLPLLALLLALLAAPALRAAESAPAGRHAVASLVSDTDAVQAGHTFRVGLLLRVAPGWHVYWKNPGEAGAPPELALSLPPGASAGSLAWPAPQRMTEGQLTTYGYTGEVLLPVTVTPPPGGGAMPISAQADWLVCRDICVPEQGSFHLDLPAGTAAPSAQAALFARADQAMPLPSPFAARIGHDGTLRLEGDGLSAASVASAWFAPDAAGPIDPDAPEVLGVAPGVLTLKLKPGEDFHAGAPLRGVLVLQDPHGQQTALQIAAAPGDAIPVAAEEPAMPLGQMLLLAVLGGLVLNLMPCVFPVLAMKAMALARLGRAERGEVRAHAVSYAGGVLVAFGLLAAVTLALRAAGAAAGWGFQFQSPAFVAAMAWVLFGIGLNLSGVFALGGGGAGQALAGRGGHLGSFFTGLLAVVVATPCTAPFMAAALAAGLVAPPAVMVAVFLAMGAGLAAPWLLLAAAPGLARSLPRPGAWMELLRQALAFPMYAACAWLVWVISEETGPGGVLGTVAGLVLLGFAGWALGAGQRMAMQEVAAPAASLRSWHRTAQAAAVAAVLAAMAVLPGIAGATPGGSRLPDIAGLPSEPYSPTRLAALRAEGRPVFVDMTAAWCVTCLVNERVALGPKSVRDAFAADHVAYLKGDWTRQDPDITAFLRANHRDGVPLYLLYPATGTPIVLPQILTERTMLSALARGS